MSLQETLAKRQAANAEAQAPQIQTGIQNSLETADVPADIPPAPTIEELLKDFDTKDLPENTYALLGETVQLLMPAGRYLRGDANNFVHGSTDAEIDRLDYFAEQGLCHRMK